MQDYPNLEYIVIDGGSTDATVDILKKYGRFITWVSEPDEGQTDAINKGLHLATGEIVAYLNSDDIYEPGALRYIADVFSRNKDIAMIYGDIIHIDEMSRFIEFHKTGEVNLKKYLMAGDFYLPQPSVFFLRKVIDAVGYFDKKLHLAMDYDYWLKIIMKYKTQYEPVTFSRARIYPSAKSSSLNYKYLDELLAIYQSLFAQYPELEPFRNDVFGYAYFVGALTYMKRHYFGMAAKNFRLAIGFDSRYIVHPYLYWGYIELCIGEKNAEKIRPLLKKILGVIIPEGSYNIIR